MEAPTLLLYGVNHRSAGVAERESLALSREECARVLAATIPPGGDEEALILSTCNRTECYLVAHDPEATAARLREAVVAERGADLMAPGPHRYPARDTAAARHLFRVATGLDSMILGDTQVLGQVRGALQLAREAGTAGWFLERLLAGALRTGKRARRETAIGAGASSVGAAAVEMLRRELGTLERRCVLVVGAGKTGRLIARHLAAQDAVHVTVANRTGSTAETLAAEIGGQMLPLEELRRGLLVADAVITATAADVPLVDAGLARTVADARRRRPLVIVDVAVPRNVAPDVALVPGIVLRDIDSLKSVVDQSLSRRLAAVPDVERIVEEELRRFEAWRRGRAAAPIVRELREHFERVRAEELDRLLRGASEDERRRAERLTRTLVNRLLHVPTVTLKSIDPVSDAGRVRLQTARDLFALGRTPVRRGDPDAR